MIRDKLKRVGQPVVYKVGFNYYVGTIEEYKEETAVVRLAKHLTNEVSYMFIYPIDNEKFLGEVLE